MLNAFKMFLLFNLGFADVFVSLNQCTDTEI